MTPMSARFHVARWEFLRFVKPNQLVISFVLTLLMGALGYGVARLAGRSDSRIHDVAVIGGAPLGIAIRDTVGNIGIIPADLSQLDSLRGALTARTIEGIVVLGGTDSAQLIARRNPVWRGALEAHLATARQRVELVRSGLPASASLRYSPPSRYPRRICQDPTAAARASPRWLLPALCSMVCSRRWPTCSSASLPKSS